MQKVIIILLLILTVNKANTQSPFWQNEFPFESANTREAYEALKEFNLNAQQLEKRNDYLYQLDSSYFYNGTNGLSSKSEFIAEENRDIFLNYNFTDNQNTQPSNYLIYTFKDELLISQTYNLWSGDTSSLNESDPDLVRNFKYNSQDLLIEQTALNKNDILFGGKGNRINYTYDENNLPTGRLHYFWNYETNTYELAREVIYRNNNKGLLSEIVNLEFQEEYGWYQLDSTVFHIIFSIN